MSPLVFAIVLLTAAIHASWNFLTKKASGNLAVLVSGVWVGSLILLPWSLVLGSTASQLSQALPFMLATGSIHFVYFITLARAYQFGEISAVYPIARGLGVAGTAVGATLLLNERLSPYGVAGILAVALGALLIGFVRVSRQYTRSILYAAVVGLSIVAYSLVDKTGVGLVHPVVYASGLFSFAAAFLSIYLLATDRAAFGRAWRGHWRYCLMIGAGLVGTYVIILSVYKVANVSYVVAVREMSVVIGALLGFRFLKERVTARKAVGIAAVAVGLILIKAA